MSGGRLRNRVVAAIVATTMVTSLLFGVATFAFAYSLEDRLFEEELAREINHQQTEWRRGGALPPSIQRYILVYRSPSALPADLAPQMREEPARTEFFGDQGRHYHIARFRLEGPDGGDAVAVAEGSRYLLVRPVRNSIILFLGALSIIVALVAALLGRWAANRALAPLSRLAADVTRGDRLADDLGVPRIDVQRYPANEIGVLAQALDRAFDRLRAFVARERAFTRDASHELRTPLAVISGAAELLAINAGLPKSALPALRRIEGASADMAQALDLLLALARENEARRPIQLTPVLPLFESAVTSAATRYPSNDLEITLAVDASATLPVEPMLLQLILNNLIGNAFQHASGSRLHVSCDGSSLIVSDTGPGLDAFGDRFAPFARGVNSSGSGLGLEIVGRLCDAAGIGFTWDASNRQSGARFVLSFPEPS